MIVADLPQYQAARTRAHALNLEIDELTMTLDCHDAEFHNQGIPTSQSVLSTLRAFRSTEAMDTLRTHLHNKPCQSMTQIRRSLGWSQSKAELVMAAISKKSAGRLLDGVEHNGTPI
jgi:hypothetical protein